MVLRKSTLLCMDILQLQRMFIYPALHADKCSVEIDRIIMGIRKITVFNHNFARCTRCMNTICIAHCNMPGILSWHQITFFIIHIFTHLNKPSETMHKMYVNLICSYLFTFPCKCSCRLAMCTAGKLNNHALFLHCRTIPII